MAVVGETNGVHLQAVVAGEQNGPNWVIDSGLQAGDRIIVEGAQKVKEGMVVDPVPYEPAATSPLGTIKAAP